MADNPLLPQERLRELRARIQHARELDRRRSRLAREALIAATMIHLSAGDLVSGPPGDSTLRELAPSDLPADPAHDVPASLRIPLCAGAARGMLTASTDRIAVVHAIAGTPEPGWADALRWAHRDRLPLLLIVADTGLATRRNSRKTTPLTWPELTALARTLHLPHFPVDGEDAVAVYRVMQETVSRARSGGGPSVLWAMLSPRRPAARQQPLARLESYMTTRGIAHTR